MKWQNFDRTIKTIMLLAAFNATFSFAQPYEQMKATIYALTINGYSLADGNSVVLDSSFSNSVDNNDVTKQNNFGENFGIQKGLVTLAIEARKNVVTVDTVYYRIWNLKQATTYKFEFTPRYFNTPGLMAVLHDNYLNADSPISIIDTTSVTFAVTSVAGSYAQDRFKLYLKVSTLPLNFSSYNAIETQAGIGVNWRMAGGTAFTRFEIEHAADGIHFTKIGVVDGNADMNTDSRFTWVDRSPLKGVNFYRIKAISASGRPLYSGVMKVSITKNSSFAILQNPITGNRIQLVFTGQPAGRYAISLFNQYGQIVHNRVINHSGGSGTFSFNIGQTPSGAYQLQIIAPTGIRNVIQVVCDGK